jgi:hypothetical protein
MFFRKKLRLALRQIAFGRTRERAGRPRVAQVRSAVAGDLPGNTPQQTEFRATPRVGQRGPTAVQTK